MIIFITPHSDFPLSRLILFSNFLTIPKNFSSPHHGDCFASPVIAGRRRRSLLLCPLLFFFSPVLFMLIDLIDSPLRNYMHVYFFLSYISLPPSHCKKLQSSILSYVQCNTYDIKNNAWIKLRIFQNDQTCKVSREKIAPSSRLPKWAKKKNQDKNTSKVYNFFLVQ